MKRLNSYEPFTLAVVKWLARVYFGPNQRFDLTRRLLQKYHRILKTRGTSEAIKFCKGLRASLLEWLATLENLDAPSRARPNRILHKDLRSLMYMADLDYPFLRLVLSALYISRGLELPESYVTSTITDPPLYRSISHMGKYTHDFWKELGIYDLGRIPRSVYWKKFHFTTKSGPNGHALWSSVADLSILPEDLKEDLKTIGGKKFTSRMDCLGKYLNFLGPVFRVLGKRFRKISFIRDQEGKTRQIAILDYWSQTALRGLHQYLFGILKRIPQDCTFDQGSFVGKLGIEDGTTFYSVDLTAFTDRWPILLIEMLLKARFTHTYVNSWRRVMVGYPFDTDKAGSLTYSVGNPMGAYSSWNSAALSHHYMVYYCCRELGINWKDAKYTILGDDIVIKDDALAKKYIECLDSIGVAYSPSKTHVSKHMFEFAKRVFHCGVEVTPFPVSALWTTRHRPSLMLGVLHGEERKGWVSSIGTPAALSELYSYLSFNRSYRARLKKVLSITYQILIAFQGRMTAVEAFKPLLVEYYPSLVNDPNLSTIALARVIHKAFERSADPGKGREPLGLIAERLVCLITGDDNAACDAFDLIASLPVLQIHGQIEEVYLKVMRNPRSAFPLIMSGDWKTAVKALTIPISDRVYYSRNQDLVVQASFSLARSWIVEMDKEASVRKSFNLDLLSEIFSFPTRMGT